jgi:clan AA aspartic protease
VIGQVDEGNRALLEIRVGNRLNGEYTPVTAWIDTAFDGHLVFPLKLIRDLPLDELGETEAVLADGSKVILDTYLCYVEWFGKRMPLQVVANEGRFPRLGAGLLERHVLHVDYLSKSLTLD